MKNLALTALLLAGAAFSASAQQWEFGGVGGAAFLNTVPVSGAGSATAGFSQGGVFGGFLGQNISSHIAGQIRYEYMQSDLSLKSGGQSASFAGVSHALHYDVLIHTNRPHSP